MVLKSSGKGWAKNSDGDSEQMIKPRAGQARQARDADDVFGVGGVSPAAQVGAEHKKRADQARWPP